MKQLFTILFLLFSSTLGLLAQSVPFADVPAGSRSLSTVPSFCKYNTVAHRLLQVEELAFADPNADYIGMYSALDSVIDKAVQKIQPLLAHNQLSGKESAQRILEAIDQSLWEMDFIVCIKTHFLQRALARRKLPLGKSRLHFWSREDARPGDSTVYFGASLNATAYPQVTLMSGDRKDEFLAAPQSHYRLIDCDLMAYLYLAIAEVLELPIYLVEVPGHFFVRYEYSDSDYLNWDNNSAKEYSDDDFRDGLTPSTSRQISKEDEEAYPYLQSLSGEEAMALHTSFIVGGRVIRSDPDLALQILDYVAEINPESDYAHPRIAQGYNSFGYARSLEGDFGASIPHFSSALEFQPEFGPAHDNLGFALIQTGDLEGGRACLEKAESCGTNYRSYSCRNWGSYYAAIGEKRKAKKQYRKALKLGKDEPVDLLEFEYARLLLDKGKGKKAQKYLEIAAERGEGLAIQKLNELQSN